MVHRKTRKRTPLSSLELYLIFLGLLVVAMLIALAIILHSIAQKNIEQNTEIPVPASQASASESSEKTEVETPKYEKIDFQPVVDSWVGQVGGNKGVMIYDLERDEIVGEYHSDQYFSTASLYKLFVVYVGYTMLESGEWSQDDAAGATGHTIVECLDLAIRESNSECAETIWYKYGWNELDQTINEKYLIDTTTPSQLSSNARDIAKMMKIFFWHREISDADLIARMKDSFLNQPTTNYNWRQGLPSGFSDSVKVYNKVGWDYNPDDKYWNLYHDAAIVEFPDGRHFVVVAMTSHVPFQQIKKLGTMIEEAY